MTISGWIEAMSKFPANTEVQVRMSRDAHLINKSVEMLASRPTFNYENGCGDVDFLEISLTDEDEGVEDVSEASK